MAGLNIPWLDTGWYNTGNSMLPGGHVRYDPMTLWYANIGDAAVNYARNYNAANVMENIYQLDVPLECSVSIGDNWGELK